MLRRVARVSLLLFGSAAVVLLLLNVFVRVQVFSSWPAEQVLVVAAGGRLEVAWYSDISALPNQPDPPAVDVATHAPYLPSGGWPRLSQIDAPGFVSRRLSLPLWLLAAVCLAWPVTSFIVARRRRGQRGFEVDAKGMSNVERPTSNVEDAG